MWDSSNFFKYKALINLSTRVDRLTAFFSQEETKGVDINVHTQEPLTVVPATDNFIKHDRRSWKRGCIEAHYNLIKMARDTGMENILIFEDDAVFDSKFLDLAPPIINEMVGVGDWDLFYFGGEPHGVCIPYTDNISFTPKKLYQTHAYAVNSSYYDKILSMNIDRVHNIDIFYIHCDAKAYMSRECLVRQREDFSDNHGNFTSCDYDKHYAKWVRHDSL